jgi:hypothetical protein
VRPPQAGEPAALCHGCTKPAPRVDRAVFARTNSPSRVGEFCRGCPQGVGGGCPQGVGEFCRAGAGVGVVYKPAGADTGAGRACDGEEREITRVLIRACMVRAWWRAPWRASHAVGGCGVVGAPRDGSTTAKAASFIRSS